MHRRTFLRGVGGAAAAIVPGARSRADEARPFRLGVTRWPPDLTLAAVAAVDGFVARDCDMAAPMLYGGVPWTEAASGAPFAEGLRVELAYRPPAGHKLLLSLGPLDLLRRGMAPYWGERENMPVPPQFAGRSLDDPQVMASFAAFALRACEAMRPDWLAIGIELNALLSNAPQAWPALKALYRHGYAALKARFPDLPVCFTIEAQHYLGNADGADHPTQRRELLDLLQHSDLVAFSIYPHMSWATPRPLPDGYFDFAAELADAAGGKPVAVTESGYTSRNVMIGAIPLFGSPEEQERHVDLLLAAARRDRYAFVVNFASHDFEPLTARLPPAAQTLARIWTYTGLKRSDGADKPAMTPWRRHLAVPAER
ncbi:MAG: hypothetical protein R3F55_07825 [Alphaproteobacteria bacterium]